MTDKSRALPFGTGLSPTVEPASSLAGFAASIPSADEYDDFDYDDGHCGNCGDEGFVYGCSWDWQCDTYDAGEGTCLCTRRCDWCNPGKRDPELDALLSEMLAEPRPSTGGEG